MFIIHFTDCINKPVCFSLHGNELVYRIFMCVPQDGVLIPMELDFCVGSWANWLVLSSLQPVHNSAVLLSWLHLHVVCACFWNWFAFSKPAQACMFFQCVCSQALKNTDPNKYSCTFNDACLVCDFSLTKRMDQEALSQRMIHLPQKQSRAQSTRCS